MQIETLSNDIGRLEKSLDELREEKKEFLRNKMNEEQDDERQQLLRLLTQEKVCAIDFTCIVDLVREID
jgi:uncharacterized protein with gpF-like domain